MTEIPKKGPATETKSEAEEEKKADVPFIGCDWYLRSLVTLVNESDLSVAITLSVRGTLISGSLTSGKNYFVGFAQDVLDGLGGEAKVGAEQSAAIHTKFTAPAKFYEKPAEGASAPPPPHYAHLKSAKFYRSGGASAIPEKRVGDGWVRVRLDSVDAFVLGALDGDKV